MPSRRLAAAPGWVQLRGQRRELGLGGQRGNPSTRKHLEQRLEPLVDRRVDADLYLALADLHIRQGVCVLAYLAECAFVFARREDLSPTIGSTAARVSATATPR